MLRALPSRLALLGLVLVGAPAHASERCDTKQVETLTARLPGAPAVVHAGSSLTVPVSVVRAAGTPAELGAFDVEVLVGLTGKGWGAYDRQVSATDGTATARVAVPSGVTGTATLDVEVVRVVVAAPCLNVEEHGRTTRPWGRATR
jgi:hypothetical protein